MVKLIGVIAFIGVSVLVLFWVMAGSALAGAAAITFALAALGGLFGMLGGIVLLIALPWMIRWLWRRGGSPGF